MLVKHFKDMGWSVIAHPKGSYVEFTVHEIIGHTEDGNLLYEGCIESVEDAVTYLSGSVKWDECSNWYFDEQDDCMLHACTREDLTNLGEIMGKCWDWAGELITNWQGSLT